MVGRILAVNLAVPRTIPYRGRRVPTGIYKVSVEHPVLLQSDGVRGDTVADLRVHGGPHKAVYAYPSEHYAWWREQLGNLPTDASRYGVFGENLTTEGVTEDCVYVGDRFEAGGALLEAAQPRQPCFKFIHKMGTPNASTLMVSSGRCGIYFRVIEAGEVRAGDPMTRVHMDPRQISIRELNDLVEREDVEPSRLQKILEVEQLTDSWRERVRTMLAISD
jgi:MOSC domain-containing protein YiiM